MKLRHLLTAAVLALPMCLSAKPAYPGVLTKHNPDGSVVQIRMYGDENFSYITDLDNNLLEYDAKMCLKPVLENGAKVKASAEVVEALKATSEVNAARYNKVKGIIKRIPHQDEDGRTSFNTNTDQLRGLVVLVQFSDVKFSRSDIREYIYRMFNQEGFKDVPWTECSHFGSARDYYIKCSEGKFKPTFDVSPIVTLPKTSAYYTGTGNSINYKYLHADEAFTYAAEQLKDQLDFTLYDFDKDDKLDIVYFIYAGYSQADTPEVTCMWPHQGNLGYLRCILDGKLLDSYACSSELNGGVHYLNKDGAIDGIGTFCHEFAHAIGLPDLYATDYNHKATPTNWSVMDHGTYNGEGYCPPLMSAYEKWMLKWQDYELAEDGKTYEIGNLYGPDSKIVRMPVYVGNATQTAVLKTEYFLAESRHREGFDTYLPDDGMLLWHIDYDRGVWSANEVNKSKDRTRVALVCADGSANHWLGNYTAVNMAAWPGTGINNTMITPVTDVTTQVYANSAKHPTNNMFITDIAYDPEKKVSTFGYNLYTASPTETVTLLPEVRWTGENKIHLEWTPVEGATDYKLTVVRENASGTKFYENGLNDAPIGSSNPWYDLPLSPSKMNFTYEWYVRVMKNIPADRVSRSRSFIGSMLQESGVNEIGTDTDAPVYGIAGGIVAPQNAEIYNMNGVRTGADNLPAGVYIVKNAGKTTKVVVK